MSDHDPFPNVKEKLTAPTKKSAFEKSRLEAEAKRLREEAETAAVLKDFVASFDDDPAPSFPSSSSSSTGPASGPRGGGGGFRARSAGRRHFTAGPPRKRNLEAAFERDGAGEEVAGVFGGAPMTMSMGERERERGEREKRRARGGETGLLAWENSAPGGKGDDDSDSETSKPHPKPTLSLTSLPPSTTKPILTALLASTPLRIDSIRIIPAPPPPGPSQPSPSIRKASSALVTLSPETPSSDIDAAVTSLNGRYLGSGFWLSISRHLPSTISTTTPLTTPTANPFNAIAPSAPSSSAHRHHNNHRPPPHRGGFAPPSSYRAPSTTTPSSLQVHVHPPSDLRLLRLIHKTVEGVLKHGAAFEALLMASDGVRADPRFAWLWDARSPPGVYYRWKLWSLITLQRAQPAIEMFEPTPALSALWIPPRRPLRYEFAGSLADIRADEEFTREELLDEEDEEALPPPPSSSLSLSLPDEKGADGKRGYLGVLGRAKLVHLVARIPTATTRVRRGDVGRVMAFAMEHAEGGMGEEVVDVLVGNVLRPLAFTAAARGEGEGEEERERRDNEETHAAKIIGLWVISDVLSNSSLGIRNAWRYRQLFDVALREKGVFAHLGEVYRTPGWGRMKAEKFRRGVVEGVLEWWEKWCIFPQTTQDAFLTSFLTPPTSTSTSTNNTTNNNTPPTTSTGTSTPTPTTTTTTTAPKSKWKTVEAAPSSFNPHTATATATDSDIDGDPMPADSDSDIDGEPMPDDDPMQEDDHDEDEDEDEDVKEMFDDGAAHSLAPPAGSAPRKRMRAEELWADGE